MKVGNRIMNLLEILKKEEVKSAISIGGLCSMGYLFAYLSRNILSVVTPEMLDVGYTTEYIAVLSTMFMITYAIGQLVNGIIGDYINAKYMIFMGMFTAGLCNIVFVISNISIIKIVVYTINGFASAMLYGPMVKVIAENTNKDYVTKVLLGLTFAALIASPLAGLVAIAFRWRILFVFVGVLLICFSIVSFVTFTILERKGSVEYRKYTEQRKNGGIKLLIDNGIIRYSFVSVLTGIVRTSVVFWIPAYLTQNLGYTSKNAAATYSVITLIMAMAPYIGVAIYKYVFKSYANNMLLFGFLCGTVCFFAMCVIKLPIINIILLAVALLGSSTASAMIWNVYCPSLKKTGMVSGATGYLDFISYAGGALANLLFANAVSKWGWSNLLIIWGLIMTSGIATGFSRGKNKANSEKIDEACSNVL